MSEYTRVPPPDLEPLTSKPPFAAVNEDWFRLKLFPDYAVSAHGRVARLTSSRGTKPGILLPQARLVFREGKSPAWGLFVNLYANGTRVCRNIAWLLGSIQSKQKSLKERKAPVYPERTADLPLKTREKVFNMFTNLHKLDREEAWAMAARHCDTVGITEDRLREEVNA